jgi:CRP-like cAMP-binding protein
MTTAEIEGIDLFRTLPRPHQGDVARSADRVSLGAGKTLTRQGELAHEFFVIVDGVAEVECDGQVVSQLGPGDFFGELGLLGRPIRTATVRATSDMEIAVIGRRAFHHLIRRSPELANTVLAAGNRRLARSIRLAETGR